jgi:hypothetical protein
MVILQRYFASNAAFFGSKKPWLPESIKYHGHSYTLISAAIHIYQISDISAPSRSETLKIFGQKKT